MKESLEKYLKELKAKYRTGLTTEASYYPVLEELLDELLRLYKRKGNVINIPKKTEIGIPDFIINEENYIKIGNVEAKDLFEDLNHILKTEQVKRYNESIDNFILTNYLEFWLFRDGKKIDTLRLIEESEFEKKQTFSLKDIEEIQQFFDSFFSYSTKPIYKPKELALELAKRTKLLKVNTKEILEVEHKEGKGKLNGILEAFKQHLISDLSLDDFADMYAQTITYGLLLAKINSDGKFDITLAHRFIPKTISLLNDMFRFLAEEDLPQALVWIVKDITNVLNNADISNILKEMYKHVPTKDPIIHFYETFLAQYNPKLRKSRGVYYTPEPVVSFIVRSANILLKEKFEKTLGLADNGIKVLDPACGTATFLAQVIGVIYEEIMNSGKKGIFPDVAENHILKDIYGFELLMAPYAMAHLKLSLRLKELGYEIKEDERFKIYLTNTLESKDIRIIYLPFYESLTKESAEAQKVKQEAPILVVLGNPPYSVSSYNKSDFIENLMEDYKKDVKGERNIQPLSDDYIKFIRFAQWKIEQGGKGIFSYISNNSYLSGLIHRGMRKKLLDCFDEIYILNLHGNSNIGETCLDGSKDENVFDIKQGVGIAIFVKKEKRAKEAEVFYKDLFGLREVKYDCLLYNDVKTVPWEKLITKEPYYFFVPKEFGKEKEYRSFLSLAQIFGVFNSGVKTHRDHFIVDFDKESLINRLKEFLNEDLTEKEISQKFDIRDTRDWKVEEAREKLRIDKLNIRNYAYRPFDIRYIAYEICLIDRGCDRYGTMKHFFHDNLGLATLRSTHLAQPFTNIFITKYVSDIHYASDQCYIFPLYLYPDKNKNEFIDERRPNLSSGFLKNLSIYLNSDVKQKGEVGGKLIISPELILFYCYGVMHSATYRKDYDEFLKIDFPRIPFTKDYNLFLEISKIGEEIGRLHLLESPLLNKIEAEYPVSGDHIMEKPMYDEKAQKIYINKNQYFGKVSKDIWEFTIGGYQVLDKYLKSRKNRNLSQEEIEHLLKVITALKYTIEKMKVADELFKKIDLNNLITMLI